MVSEICFYIYFVKGFVLVVYDIVIVYLFVEGKFFKGSKCFIVEVDSDFIVFFKIYQGWVEFFKFGCDFFCFEISGVGFYIVREQFFLVSFCIVMNGVLVLVYYCVGFIGEVVVGLSVELFWVQ